MGRTRLLITDFVLSFMWAWSGVLIKIFVYKYLGMSRDPLGDIVNTAFVIANMFFFAILMLITHGAFNPLTVLANAISGDFSQFLYCVGARIPTQVRFLVFLCDTRNRLSNVCFTKCESVFICSNEKKIAILCILNCLRN